MRWRVQRCLRSKYHRLHVPGPILGLFSALLVYGICHTPTRSSEGPVVTPSDAPARDLFLQAAVAVQTTPQSTSGQFSKLPLEDSSSAWSPELWLQRELEFLHVWEQSLLDTAQLERRKETLTQVDHLEAEFALRHRVGVQSQEEALFLARQSELEKAFWRAVQGKRIGDAPPNRFFDAMRIQTLQGSSAALNKVQVAQNWSASQLAMLVRTRQQRAGMHLGLWAEAAWMDARRADGQLGAMQSFWSREKASEDVSAKRVRRKDLREVLTKWRMVARAQRSPGYPWNYYSLPRPVDGAVMQRHAERWPSSPRSELVSDGVFMASVPGAWVRTPVGGRVREIVALPAGQKVLVIDAGNAYRVVLGELSELVVKLGERVLEGQWIGRVAVPSTDDNYPATLYLEMWHGARALDPQRFLRPYRRE